MGIDPKAVDKGKDKSKIKSTDDCTPASNTSGHPSTSIYSPKRQEQTVFVPPPKEMIDAAKKKKADRDSSQSQLVKNTNSVGSGNNVRRNEPRSGSRMIERSSTSGQLSTNQKRQVVPYRPTQQQPDDPGFGMMIPGAGNDMLGGGFRTHRRDVVYREKYLPGIWGELLENSSIISDLYIEIRRCDQVQGSDLRMQTKPHPNPARLTSWSEDDIRFDCYEPRAPNLSAIETHPHYFELHEVETLIHLAMVHAIELGLQGHDPWDICPAFAEAGQYNEDWSKWQAEGTITLTTMTTNLGCAVATIYTYYVNGYRFIICPRKMMRDNVISWDLIDVDRYQVTRGQQLPPPELMRGWFASHNLKYHLSEAERDQLGDMWKEGRQQVQVTDPFAFTGAPGTRAMNPMSTFQGVRGYLR